MTGDEYLWFRHLLQPAVQALCMSRTFAAPAKAEVEGERRRLRVGWPSGRRRSDGGYREERCAVREVIHVLGMIAQS